MEIVLLLASGRVIQLRRLAAWNITLIRTGPDRGGLRHDAQNPADGTKRFASIADMNHFTDREQFIHSFHQYVEAPEEKDLRVLNFYGVGGIGKTTLINKLNDDLREADPPVPHARFDIQNVTDPTQAYRLVLLSLSHDLEREFGLGFPHFVLCWAVMAAREGGEPPPLVKINPLLSDIFKFALKFIESPLPDFTNGVQMLADRSETFEAWSDVPAARRMSFACVRWPSGAIQPCRMN